MADFGAVFTKERERLEKIKEDAEARKAAIDQEIAEVDKELKAFDAYQAVKEGKGERKKKSGGKKGEKRTALLDLIKSAPQGLTRGEIIEKLGATEKSAQQSVSNALSALFKNKSVSRKEGRYLLA